MVKKKEPPEEGLFLRNGTAELILTGSARQKIPLEEVIVSIQGSGISGMDTEALPDKAKWKVTCGPVTLFILQLGPMLRAIKWIAPNSPAPLGPGARYGDYRLATPFIVLKVPFLRGSIQHRCELFYRNQPLQTLDDELYWSNLLNVSPNAYGSTAWLCTQNLVKEIKEIKKSGAPSGEKLGMNQQLDALLTHLLEGGFNLSSEMSEGSSCFSKAVRDKIDARVTDVERWQKESIKDDKFPLKVDWKPTGLTVGSLIYNHLKSSGVLRDLTDTSELISVLLCNRKKGPSHVR